MLRTGGGSALHRQVLRWQHGGEGRGCQDRQPPVLLVGLLQRR